MSDEKRLKWGLWLSILAILGTIGIPVLINLGINWGLAIVKSMGTGSEPAVTLSSMVISGVIGLLAILTLVTVTFYAVRLADPKQALGLPEGSIRAVIALSLIVIYVVVAIFLFWRIGETNTAQQDFAKQMLTTISTLVVAVAGFYFGARAVEAAKPGATPPPPIIRSVSPSSRNVGEGEDGETLTVIGRNFNAPKTVRLTSASKPDVNCTDILSSESKIQCKLSLKDIQPGVYDLLVINDDGSEDRLEGAFEVTAPTPS